MEWNNDYLVHRINKSSEKYVNFKLQSLSYIYKHINHFTLVMSNYNNVMTWIIWDQYSLFTSEWNTKKMVTLMHVYACQSQNFLFDAHIHANFSKDCCTNGNLVLRQQFYYIFSGHSQT